MFPETMKTFKVLLFVICLIGFAQADLSTTNLQCDYTLPSITTTWIQMANPCINALQNLIANKINNVLQYLALANYYLKDDVNRPGFANQFILDAYEDRSTAINFIDYLTMRGQNAQGQLLDIPINFIPPVTQWTSLIEASTYVLQFESNTTSLYHSTIATCEQSPFADYHLDNWLATEFLGAQLDGLKVVADRLSSLTKMQQDHQSLGEYLYDIQLYYSLPDRDCDDY